MGELGKPPKNIVAPLELPESCCTQAVKVDWLFTMDGLAEALHCAEDVGLASVWGVSEQRLEAPNSADLAEFATRRKMAIASEQAFLPEHMAKIRLDSEYHCTYEQLL